MECLNQEVYAWPLEGEMKELDAADGQEGGTKWRHPLYFGKTGSQASCPGNCAWQRSNLMETLSVIKRKHIRGVALISKCSMKYIYIYVWIHINTLLVLLLINIYTFKCISNEKYSF